MRNLLLEKAEYLVERTRFGTWRRFLHPNGSYFAEFRSHRSWRGWPLLHYTRGISPETGRRVVARGVIAVGRLAVGGLAIGQAAFGVVAVGQLGVGLLCGLGQAAAGVYALGQLALAASLGLGQVATGVTAIGQIGIGEYVLAQIGVGRHLWTPGRADPEAVAHFTTLWEAARAFLGLA